MYVYFIDYFKIYQNYFIFRIIKLLLEGFLSETLINELQTLL